MSLGNGPHWQELALSCEEGYLVIFDHLSISLRTWYLSPVTWGGMFVLRGCQQLTQCSLGAGGSMALLGDLVVSLVVSFVLNVILHFNYNLY